MRRTPVFAMLPALLLGVLGGQAAFAQSGDGQKLSRLAVEVPPATRYAAMVHHSNATKPLHITVCLPFPDVDQVEGFVDSVSDPKSPNYRHFITPQEVGTRFGQPLTVLNKMAAYLASKGMTVNLIAKNRLSILADATVAQAEAAFHTTINDYQNPTADENGNRAFFSNATPLQIPAELSPFVCNVAGLENYTRPRKQGFTPNQIRTLYNLAPMYAGGYQGQGRHVAISNFDGFRLSNLPLFYSQFGLPTPPGGVGSNVNVVALSGGAGSGNTGAEGDLDIQMVLAMAPLCSLTVYDGGSSDLFGVLTRELNDNTADIISESYGWSLGGSSATAAHNLHLSMNAQGITYMAASGDSGTTIEPYSYPDYEPEVLIVGGTVPTTNQSGVRSSEVGWSGSGGGWSTNTASFNLKPSWQTGNGVPSNIPYRMVPDVALCGGATYQFYLNGSLNSGYTGTSFACPVFAGSLAVAEQKLIAQGALPADNLGHQRFGRIQDLIYSQNGRSDIWNDITSGANGTLPNGSASSAGTGWDTVTGWGTPDFNAFVNVLAAASQDFSLSGAPASQTVIQGSGANYTITVNALNGFSGTTNLSVTGLPSGAGATLSPTSVAGAGTSTLSVTTSNNTPVGTYPLTVTGLSGSSSHTTNVTLIVHAPIDFTLTATPSSRSIVQGTSTTFGLTETAQGGFTAATALSVSGLPSGASASFAPASIPGGAGSSTMTVTSLTSATPGTYPLTITGTSGNLTHSTVVSLTITGIPTFTLSVSPSSQSIARTRSGQYVASVNALYGFSGTVTLSATGLPSGVTAVFAPKTMVGGGSSTITVSASTSASLGSHTFTVKAVSGSISKTFPVTVIVTAAPAFTLTVTPPTNTVVQGSSATYNAVVAAQNGFTGTVNFTVTGLPSHATASFSPLSVATSGSSVLTVVTASNTPTGTYHLSVAAVNGSVSHKISVTLKVVAPPDFTITSSPTSRTVTRGLTTTYKATIAAKNAFTGQVSLSVNGLPAGVTATFNPTSVNNSGTSTLTVVTTSGATAGTYTLTLTGTSGSKVHSVNVKLILR